MIKNLSYVFVLAAMFVNGVYGAERSITPDPHPAKRTAQMQAQLGERIDQENRREAQQRAIRAQEAAVRNIKRALGELREMLKYTNEDGYEEVEFTKLRDRRIENNALVLALNDFITTVGISDCITNDTELAVNAIHHYGARTVDTKIVKSDLKGVHRSLGNNWIAFESILPPNDRSGINGETIRYYNQQTGLYVSILWKGNLIKELSVHNVVDPTVAPDEIKLM